MFNSCTTLSSSSPIFLMDNNNIGSYPDDDIANPYSNLPLLSPLIYNELSHLANDYNYPSNNELGLIQQMVESNINSSILTEESGSFLEATTRNKMDSIKKDEVNERVDDVGTDKIIGNKASHGLKRRRTSTRDRHSKIQTAHGLRDRRMRLSLEIGRQFFRLQDILGYDKASRTIEWLLTQSKPAIEELLQSQKGSPNGVTKSTISSTPECEDEFTVVKQRKANSKGKKVLICVGKDTNKPKQKRMVMSKEARNVKRGNTREKTLEKKNRIFTKDGEKSSSRNHLTMGACEVTERFNDLQPVCHKDCVDPLGVREDHGDDTFNGVWNPLPTFSYSQMKLLF